MLSDDYFFLFVSLGLWKGAVLTLFWFGGAGCGLEIGFGCIFTFITGVQQGPSFRITLQMLYMYTLKSGVIAYFRKGRKQRGLSTCLVYALLS